MNLTYEGKKISGILTVLPANVSRFDDETGNYTFPKEKTLRLKPLMGFDEHRIVEDGVCVSDLCVFGLKDLFARGLLRKEDIDALVLVTQSPDQFMPPTSNIIQGLLELKRDMICLDINQGCAGFEIGLLQAFALLDQPAIRKVVLLNADVLSRKTSRQDRNSFPLIGDGASITVVEKDPEGGRIHANIQMDGTLRNALAIPAGGFRMPSTPETAAPVDDGTGNLRAKDHLVMNGQDVFTFVMTEVPPMILSLAETAGIGLADIDWFLFHQPNKFMIQKLAEKLEVPPGRMPGNVVEKFGNASGVTIPTNVCLNLGEKLKDQRFTVCFAGFGVGLTWSSILMTIGNMEFCEIVNY
ncbi:3-oxoacyl-ACP synthase III family protein [Geothrix sp. 21YS21S-2]|uniref:3-oxoacyl-ACP synthase III family protein n=1 Tax=Geothrix sp. 21YS21S-2 TaxID=3068893 RepID=UPI0027BAC1D6|nr:ketoacyl-ACP synthase III [Geothrix sp. 21YS21S-2]